MREWMPPATGGTGDLCGLPVFPRRNSMGEAHLTRGTIRRQGCSRRIDVWHIFSSCVLLAPLRAACASRTLHRFLCTCAAPLAQLPWRSDQGRHGHSSAVWSSSAVCEGPGRRSPREPGQRHCASQGPWAPLPGSGIRTQAPFTTPGRGICAQAAQGWQSHCAPPSST